MSQGPRIPRQRVGSSGSYGGGVYNRGAQGKATKRASGGGGGKKGGGGGGGKGGGCALLIVGTGAALAAGAVGAAELVSRLF